MFYALYTLCTHGIGDASLHDVFIATIINHLLYAVNSWRHLATREHVTHINQCGELPLIHPTLYISLLIYEVM